MMTKRRVVYPTSYVSLAEMRKALLRQARLFSRLRRDVETAAKPIILSAPSGSKPIPKPAKTKDLDTLETLLAQSRVLKNMSAQLVTTFKGNPKAASVKKAVDALTVDVDKRAVELRQRLGKESRQKVSQSIVRLNHGLQKLLEEDLKGFFADMKEMYLVAPITAPGIADPIDAEIAFIRVTNLKGSDGFVNPLYFVIIAHPLKKASSAAPMLLATTTEFRVPSRIRWEATARSGNELHKVVKDLLSQDGILGKAFTRNIPVPPSRIKFSHDNVEKTTVKGDVVTVKVRDVKQIDNTANELRAQLQSIVRQVDPSNKDIIRHKVERNTSLIRIIFSLPKRLKGRLVTDNTMARIRQVLDLSPEELQRVKTALENPEE